VLVVPPTTVVVTFPPEASYLVIKIRLDVEVPEFVDKTEDTVIVEEL
jgi:hypothetical protein